MKNDTSLFSLRNIKILTNMQKIFFEILVETALTAGLIWTILKLTPKSALLSFTILYSKHSNNKVLPNLLEQSLVINKLHAKSNNIIEFANYKVKSHLA